jgi:hypothetical protein
MSAILFMTAALTANLVWAPIAASDDSTAIMIAKAGRQVTPAQAAPFVADWTLALQGPNGPGTFELSVKVEKEQVTGEISSEQLPRQPISQISMADKSLVLGYSFTWEGNPVDAAVSLTPAADGKMTAQIDFANGAYIMSGTATKKEKSKQ